MNGTTNQMSTRRRMTMDTPIVVGVAEVAGVVVGFPSHICIFLGYGQQFVLRAFIAVVFHADHLLRYRAHLCLWITWITMLTVPDGIKGVMYLQE
jgi:hypothetical protein